MSDIPYDPVQQFVVDTFKHHSIGSHGFVYARLLPDLASLRVNPVFTKTEDRMAALFNSYPEWSPNGIVIDMEASHQRISE